MNGISGSCWSEQGFMLCMFEILSLKFIDTPLAYKGGYPGLFLCHLVRL